MPTKTACIIVSVVRAPIRERGVLVGHYGKVDRYRLVDLSLSVFLTDPKDACYRPQWRSAVLLLRLLHTSSSVPPNPKICDFFWRKKASRAMNNYQWHGLKPRHTTTAYYCDKSCSQKFRRFLVLPEERPVVQKKRVSKPKTAFSYSPVVDGSRQGT